MRLAGRGGSEEEVEDVDEDEDEEEVVVLGDVGCAATPAGAALWASASRHCGQNGGHLLGLRVWGGWRGGPGRDLAAWRADPVGSGGREGAGLRSPNSGVGGAGLLQCVRACSSASAGGNSSRRPPSGVGGVGPGVSVGCVGGVCGSRGGVGVPSGVGLFAVGVCGLPGVGGGGGRSAGGSVAGLCG